MLAVAEVAPNTLKILLTLSGASLAITEVTPATLQTGAVVEMVPSSSKFRTVLKGWRWRHALVCVIGQIS